MLKLGEVDICLNSGLNSRVMQASRVWFLVLPKNFTFHYLKTIYRSICVRLPRRDPHRTHDLSVVKRTHTLLRYCTCFFLGGKEARILSKVRFHYFLQTVYMPLSLKLFNAWNHFFFFFCIWLILKPRQVFRKF